MNLKTKNADFLLNTFSFISKFSIGAYYSKKVLHVYQTGKNYYDVAFLGTLSKKICYTYKVKGYIQLNRACGLKKPFWRFWVILAIAKTVGVHFLIFWYFPLHGYIFTYPHVGVQNPCINILNLALNSLKISNLAHLISVSGRHSKSIL